MESRPNWNQIGNKTCYKPKVSKFFVGKRYMLTGLKVSSLAFKCVFCRREHNSNRRAHGIEL